MQSRLLLEKYSEILGDLKELINNQEFINYKYSEEREPNSYHFNWKNLNSNEIEYFEVSNLEKPEIPKDSRNIICKKCPDRAAAIRGFIQKGNIKILVLHYTGELNPNKKVFSKLGKNQIFREGKQEEIFDRLLKKVFSHSIREFYFQEFPGCNFNHKNSNEKDWKRRCDNCLDHVEETVISEDIQGIIITGRAAVSYYGYSQAESLLEKIIDFKIKNISIPAIVIRSPEKLLSLEYQKNKFENNKNSKEYKIALEEEKVIKKQVVDSLIHFKEKLLF